MVYEAAVSEQSGVLERTEERILLRYPIPHFGRRRAGESIVSPQLHAGVQRARLDVILPFFSFSDGGGELLRLDGRLLCVRGECFWFGNCLCAGGSGSERKRAGEGSGDEDGEGLHNCIIISPTVTVHMRFRAARPGVQPSRSR